MSYVKAGKITHYFNKIQVGVLQVTDNPISIGDTILVGEEGMGFTQKVGSMQVDHDQIEEAKVGSEVGLKLEKEAHSGDVVYLVK